MLCCIGDGHPRAARSIGTGTCVSCGPPPTILCPHCKSTAATMHSARETAAHRADECRRTCCGPVAGDSRAGECSAFCFELCLGCFEYSLCIYNAKCTYTDQATRQADIVLFCTAAVMKFDDPSSTISRSCPFVETSRPRPPQLVMPYSTIGWRVQ